MRDEDLRDIVTAATDLQRGARAGVKVTVETGDRPVILRCDSRQIRQALTNLLQNAVDAIEGASRRKARVRHRAASSSQSSHEVMRL